MCTCSSRWRTYSFQQITKTFPTGNMVNHEGHKAGLNVWDCEAGKLDIVEQWSVFLCITTKATLRAGMCPSQFICQSHSTKRKIRNLLLWYWQKHLLSWTFSLFLFQAKGNYIGEQKHTVVEKQKSHLNIKNMSLNEAWCWSAESEVNCRFLYVCVCV